MLLYPFPLTSVARATIPLRSAPRPLILRHEATSRLFEKGLNIMEVAAIPGHKDLRSLQRYTHLKAEDLAEKLG